QSKQELNKKESILYDEIEATETKGADLTEDIQRVDQDEKEIKEQIHELEIKIAEKKQLKQYQTRSVSSIEAQLDSVYDQTKKNKEKIQNNWDKEKADKTKNKN